MTTTELVECRACGRTGLPERIEDTQCPHSESSGGGIGRAASRLRGLACVRAVDVVGGDIDPAGTPVVEIVVEGATVPPAVLKVLADARLAVRPAGSETRGQPTHSVVVAEA